MKKIFLFAISAMILLTAAMPDKTTTIFVIGDSTAANKDTTGGKQERGWGMMLQQCFDADYIVVDNHAVNGRSSKSFIDEGRWDKVLEKIKPGDYVVIQFGHNDEKAQPNRHTDPGSTFDYNLAKFVRETREHGGIPVLMNSVVRRNFVVKAPEIADDELLRNSTFKDGAKAVEGDSLIDTHGLYAQAPRDVAARMNCHFVDANKITHALEQGLGREGSKKLHMWFLPGEEPSEPKGKQDNTHYNIHGATVVADLLADALCKEIPLLKKYRSTSKNLLRETSPEFFSTDAARRIGDQILLYQRVTGGWPKNIDMAQPLSDKERTLILSDKQRRDDSTTDNGATTTQMVFLARLYQQTKDERYRDGFRKGVEYLLSGQYENGGWPQFWPEMRDYQIHITYNDDAMVNTMSLLRDMAEQKEPYQDYLTDEPLRQRMQAAFDRGVECILATQIVTDGELTVWCQQHDRETLKPAKARAYELPSYCSMESASIVRLLMELPHPDERVKRAVNAAMRWFEKHQIKGYRLVRTGTRGSADYDTRLVEDPAAGPLWARFYDLERCEPFVCDRDGVPRRHLSEIGSERRNHYSWYNSRPAQLFPLYEAWLKQYKQ